MVVVVAVVVFCSGQWAWQNTLNAVKADAVWLTAIIRSFAALRYDRFSFFFFGKVGVGAAVVVVVAVVVGHSLCLSEV